MQNTRNSIIAVVIIAIVATLGVVMYISQKQSPQPAPPEKPAEVIPVPLEKTIGKSVEGRVIDAYTYGNGKTNITFVGGMHGGYEWNAVLLAYNLMDYLKANPDSIPENLSVTVIPNLNPDGVVAYIGKEGRFAESDIPAGSNTAGVGRKNADNIDLNRNFACKWQPTSTWQNKPVSAGTSAFSEPESQALQHFVSDTKPTAVLFFHSASGAVYASECNNGVLPQTVDIMNTYAKASGYKAVKSFDAYPITGDAEGWLASIGIPALTVELSTHTDIEWSRNKAGILAVLQYYASH